MNDDPTSLYLEMYYAMRDGHPVVARRLAKRLDRLLQAGNYPPRYSRLEVRSYVNSVLRRTIGFSEDDQDPIHK